MYATPAEYLVDYYAAYAQDEWRVSPTLTVNYGLRYEYEPGVREANNQFTVGFDRDADFPVQVPGLALKGGLMYAGRERISDAPGRIAQRRCAAGRVCVVAVEQRRHSRRLRLFLGADAVFRRR